MAKKNLKIVESNELMSTKNKRKTPGNNLNVRHITTLTDNQKKVFNAYFNDKHIICSGAAGTGKAQSLDSKILTPDGWKTMGEISVGDEIITPKNTVSKVIGVFPQGKKDLYNVNFKDGSSTECCLDHLWRINLPNSLKESIGSKKEVVDTHKLIELIENKKSGVNISIDFVDCIDFPEKSLPIPPYTLGCLLGDGGFRGGSLVFTNADSEIISKIKNELFEGYDVVQKDEIGFVITNRTDPYKFIGKNKYISELEKMGLWGKTSLQKHIPEEYMMSSVNQRMELIRGLFDTDGTVSSREGNVSYSTSSEQMALQVKEIILSLGGKCKINTKSPFYYDKNKNRIYGSTNYELSINHPNKKDFFSLERKKSLVKRDFQQQQFRRQIESITFSRNDDCQCILIDDPEHLYITDDYIITHNTFLLLYLCLNDLLTNHEYEKIVIYRSAVQCREIGFTPGNEDEKINVYNHGIKGIIDDLCQRGDAFEILSKKDMVEFNSTSFGRSITHNNTLVMIEEAQNLTMNELFMVATRLGENSRLLVTGDINQLDLNLRKEKSGFNDFINVANHMVEFEVINFGIDDIVRSDFVKSFIKTCYTLGYK